MTPHWRHTTRFIRRAILYAPKPNPNRKRKKKGKNEKVKPKNDGPSGDGLFGNWTESNSINQYNDRFSFAWKTFLITNGPKWKAVGDDWKEPKKRLWLAREKKKENALELENFGDFRVLDDSNKTNIEHAHQPNRHSQNEYTHDDVNNNENEKQSKRVKVTIWFASNYQLKDNPMFNFNDARSRPQRRMQAYTLTHFVRLNWPHFQSIVNHFRSPSFAVWHIRQNH